MTKFTLRFPSILELLDFQTKTKTYGVDIDYGRLTMTGFFEDADVELAKEGFQAVVIEEHVNG